MPDRHLDRFTDMFVFMDNMNDYVHMIALISYRLLRV